MTIYPHTGIDSIKLGRSKEEVISHIGDPDEREKIDYPDDTYSEVLHYSELGLDLSFDSDDSGVLSSITTASDEAKLDNQKIIGTTQEEFLDKFKFFQFDEDFEESGSCYDAPSKGLSAWITDGRVSSITVFPAWINDGTPKWPD